MNFEEAIKTAIELEESIYKIYNEKAASLKSATASKVFKMLAEEEGGHVKYLRRKLEEWQSSGKVSSERINTALPDKEMVTQQLEKSGYKKDVADVDNEVAVFKQALEMETKISGFYRELVTNLEDERKSFFIEFLEIEEVHEAIIQAEINSANGSGVWFDFMEFDQEAG